MLSQKRRREILELLRNDGRVLVRDLAKKFRTWLITIRKDWESLHHKGLLERTHGGALPLRTGAFARPNAPRERTAS
jgi:DeoR/GlpR family transcriptional regulator of sugar metabolism